jgi:selenocysteine lyase/cysteine desulfurase
VRRCIGSRIRAHPSGELRDRDVADALGLVEPPAAPGTCPNRAVRRVLARLNLTVGQTLMVGDRYDTDISGAIGLHAAMDYLDEIGRPKIAEHDQELGAYAFAKLAQLKSGIRLFGPHIGRAGLVSFLLKDIHAHDVVTVADQHGVALRGGHHCNQPLMHKLGVESTARASFYFYNTTEEIDRFVEVLGEVQTFFTS